MKSKLKYLIYKFKSTWNKLMYKLMFHNYKDK